MDEETKTLAEMINEDLSTTFDEMSKEVVEANKKEAEDALREKEEEEVKGEEEKVKEEEEKEEEGKEKEKGKPSDKPTKEEEPKTDEEKSEEERKRKSEEALEFEPGDKEPNSGWDEATQEKFKQLPQDMQEFMLKRHHEMQADYTRKTKDVADIKRAIEPARALIDKLGISDGEAIQNLVGAHMLLQNKPLVGVQYLMQAYDVSLEKVTENWLDDETFAQTIKDSGRMSMIESERDEMQRGRLQVETEKAQVEIDAFKVDHPHYDKVEKQMIKLAKLAFVSGEPKPALESLYNEAMKLDPELVKATKEKPSSGKDVKQAKKAATRIKGTPKKEDEEPAKPTSIHDELSQGWDKGAEA